MGTDFSQGSINMFAAETFEDIFVFNFGFFDSAFSDLFCQILEKNNKYWILVKKENLELQNWQFEKLGIIGYTIMISQQGHVKTFFFPSNNDFQFKD